METKETPWIDAWIRWERDSKERYDCEEEEEEEPPEPTNTFEYSYRHAAGDIRIELRGFPDDSEAIWNSTGLTVWKSSDLLCDYLSNHAELLNNKRLLELGSGLGRCGILAHKLSTSRMFLTDGDTDTLQVLRSNVQLNDCDTDRVSCHQLLWGRDHAVEFVNRNDTFDILFGSDLVYVPTVIEPLLKTVATLMKDDGLFLMTHCSRREGSSVTLHMVFTAATASALEYEVIEEHDDLSLILFRFKADVKEADE